MILSVSIFIVALGLGCATVLVLRRLDSDFTRPMRRWLYFTVILWAGIALFFVAMTFQDIGVKALLIGIGVSVIGWVVTTLGLPWTHKVNRFVHGELDSRLSSDPEVADRFYSSRWTRWFMPKRKG